MNEKITDHLNYLILLKAIVVEQSLNMGDVILEFNAENDTDN